MLVSEVDAEAPAGRVFCPHCLELVRMDETEGGKRCPVCERIERAAGEKETNLGYEVNTREANPHKGRGIQEYVQSLEDQVRKDEARVPYHRGRFPVDLVAGLILVSGGLALLANAFSGEGGLFTTFINVVLPGFALILIGAVCLVFWAK